MSYLKKVKGINIKDLFFNSWSLLHSENVKWLSTIKFVIHNYTIQENDQCWHNCRQHQDLIAVCTRALLYATIKYMFSLATQVVMGGPDYSQ